MGPGQGLMGADAYPAPCCTPYEFSVSPQSPENIFPSVWPEVQGETGVIPRPGKGQGPPGTMATAPGPQPLAPLEQEGDILEGDILEGDILVVKVEDDYCWEEEPSPEAEDPSPETFRQLFRLFCYQEVAGPREA